MDAEKRTIEMYDPQGTYNEGGKGRKQCKNCAKFVGARVIECPACHYQFPTKAIGRDLIPAAATPPSSPNHPEGAGRGRKQCPKCKNYTGVRSRTCPNCQHLFGEPESNEPPKVIGYGKGYRVVYTPAGTCPIKLQSTAFDQVGEWAEKVLAHGEKNNLKYLPAALKYFLRHSFEIFSKEWQEAATALNEWVNINIVAPIQEQDCNC